MTNPEQRRANRLSADLAFALVVLLLLFIVGTSIVGNAFHWFAVGQ